MMSMTVRVPEEIYEKLVAMAAQEKTTASEMTRRVIMSYFAKEDAASPPANKEGHVFGDFKEFNWRLKNMGNADKSLEASQLTPSICVAFYEFFRAGRYGFGVEVDSK